MESKKFERVEIFKDLLFKSNAVLKTERFDGTNHVVTEISIAELVSLNDLGATDLAKIDGITNGTAYADKALVLGASKEIATITSATITTLTSTTVNATNIDAGASGTAGSVDVFPATALKGKLAVTKANNTNDDAPTFTFDAHGQATTVHVPDGGAAASYVAQSTAALSLAEVDVLDGVTLGVSQASKVLTTDAAESLLWATTDATASETVTLSVADTRTGAGATGWAIKGELATNVSLGSYANGVYGILNFTGSGGGVTGLGAGVCAEIVMSAGTGAGTYAALELEIGMPTGALSGNSGTSFMYCSLYGADAATFDTSGYLFQLAGYTKAGGKFVSDTTSGSTIRPVQVIKVKTLDGDRYLPLYSTAAIAA